LLGGVPLAAILFTCSRGSGRGGKGKRERLSLPLLGRECLTFCTYLRKEKSVLNAHGGGGGVWLGKGGRSPLAKRKGAFHGYKDGRGSNAYWKKKKRFELAVLREKDATRGFPRSL